MKKERESRWFFVLEQRKENISKTASMNIALGAKLGSFNPISAKNSSPTSAFSLDKLLGVIGLRKHVVIYCHFIMLIDILLNIKIIASEEVSRACSSIAYG